MAWHNFSSKQIARMIEAKVTSMHGRVPEETARLIAVGSVERDMETIKDMTGSDGRRMRRVMLAAIRKPMVAAAA